MTIGPISNTPAQSIVESRRDVQRVELDTEVTSGSRTLNVQESAVEAQNAESIATEQEETRETISATVSNINDFVQNFQRDLKFELAEDGSRTVIYVINSETQEIIRQIPPEEVMAISEQLKNQAKDGLLLTIKV